MSNSRPKVSDLKHLPPLSGHEDIKGALPANTLNSAHNITKPSNLTVHHDNLIEDETNDANTKTASTNNVNYEVDDTDGRCELINESVNDVPTNTNDPITDKMLIRD